MNGLYLLLFFAALYHGEAKAFGALEPRASNTFLSSKAVTAITHVYRGAAERPFGDMTTSDGDAPLLHPLARRRDQSRCQTELDTVSACVTNDFCLRCVDVAYNAVLSTTRPLCIDIVSGICPAIQSGCDCGDCVTELQDYYACRVSCLELDCSNPCNDELSTAIGCTPQAADCLSCLDSTVEDTITGTGGACDPLKEGICSAITGGCECGDCSPVLEDYYDCLFAENLSDSCPGGLECSTTSPPTASLGTLSDVVAGDPDLSSLLGAAIQAELAEDLSSADIDITCFAPTDAAFTAVDTKYLEDPWVAHLRAILKTHLFDGSKAAEEFVDGDEFVTLSGEILKVAVSGAGGAKTVTLTTGGTPASTVTVADIGASNGVIHKIDSVLLPTWKDLISLAGDLGNFSVLLELLDLTELASEIPEDGVTAFAPTDEAFAQLPQDTLDFYRDPANAAALTALLSGHFAAEVYPLRNIQDGDAITTLGGTTISTSIVEQGGTDAAVLLLNGDVAVNAADVLATNGIIHAIDQVLVEDTPTTTGPGTLSDVVAGDPDLTSLLGAAIQAELAEDLSSADIDITCFAPTDAAFTAVDTKYLEDPWVAHLRAILKTHLFDGSKAAEEFVDGDEFVTLSGEILKVAVSGAGGAKTVTLTTGGTPASTVTVADIGASNGVIHKIDSVLLPTWKDLISLAGDLGNFSVLLELLDLTELASEIPEDGVTAFAPTDEAFAQLPQDTLDFYRDPANAAALTALLSGHFSAEVYPLRNIQDGDAITMLGGTTISTSIVEQGGTDAAVLLLNGDVAVNAADVLATNGIIHAIDQVLVEDTPTTTGPGTLSDVVAGDPDLTSLLGAAIQAELAEDLSSADIDITCFAPTDAAFTAVDTKYLEDPWVAHLRAILLTHLFDGSKAAEEFVDGEDFETLSGEILTVAVTEAGGAKTVTLSTGGTPSSTVTAADIGASNGVIHKVDSVLLPTWKDLISRAGDLGNFSVLLELLDLTDLASQIPEDGGYTAFAPTDEAFAQLPQETLDYYRKPANSAALTALLSGHFAAEVYPTRNIKDGDKIRTVGGSTITASTAQQGPNEVLLLDGEAGVNMADVLASNGIIHAINQVLTPTTGDLGTLTNVLEEDPELSSLLGAAVQTGLSENWSRVDIDVTCFAPTDAAFSAVDIKFRTDPWVAHLTAILRTHLFQGGTLAQDLTDGDEIETLSGEILTVAVSEASDAKTITLSTGGTPSSTVTAADIGASNGVIHKIDTVLLPTWKDLISLAGDLGNFTVLLELLDSTELTSQILFEDGSYTVFAPTDEAFARLPQETLGFYRDPANTNALTTLLSGHFATEVYPSRNIQDGNTITTFGNTLITANVAQQDGTNEVLVLNGDVTVNTADVLATNGIIHAIDQVIVDAPPAPTGSSGSEATGTTLLTAACITAFAAAFAT